MNVATQTDAQGRYTITAVPAGNRTVRTSRRGDGMTNRSALSEAFIQFKTDS